MIKMDTSNYFGGTNNSTNQLAPSPTTSGATAPGGDYYGQAEYSDHFPIDIKMDPNESDDAFPDYSSPDEHLYSMPQALPPPIHPSPLAPGQPPINYHSPLEPVFRPPPSFYSYNYPMQRSGGGHHGSMPGVSSQGGYPTAGVNGGGSGGYQSSYWHSAHQHHMHPHYQHPPMYGSGHHHHHHHHHDSFTDMMQLSNSSGREARNRAEKNRRDKLNGSIQELSGMVHHVADSARRVDKTAVLRLTSHGLRVNYVFGKTIQDAPAEDEVSYSMTDSLMKLLDGFLITVTCKGQIVLISSAVEHHLGHCQTDLYGQNILHITHPDDHDMLKTQLVPNDLDTLFDIQPEDESGEPRQRTKEEEERIDRKLLEDKRNFTVRLARAGPRSEPTCYELVKIDGCFRRADSAPRGVKSSTFPSGLQLIRRARGRDDTIPLHSINGNDIILVAVARVIRPPKLSNRLLEANHFEYKTRHLIDGRIIDCDQRISLVAGYMTDEVQNLSPFTFMHQDDVRWVIVALRQMYDNRSCYGESCYRLVARNGHFVYLRTKGYLEIDKNTNEVHSFVCINTMVSESEGRRRIQEMKNKFSIIINRKIPSSKVDALASENPQQLEKAVMCLIQNLENTAANDDDEGEASTMPRSSVCNKQISACSESHLARQSKTPPLALIPPESSSVRSSISKSVSVVNVTVVKNFRSAMSPSVKSPSLENENSNDSTATVSSVDSSLQQQQQQLRPSVLQRTESAQESSASTTTPPSVLTHGSARIRQSSVCSSEHRVPPLPNASCGCYYNSPEDVECGHHHQHHPPTMQRQQSVLKRTHDYRSDSGESADGDRGGNTSKRRMIAPDVNAVVGHGGCFPNTVKDPYDDIERSLSEMEGDPPNIILNGEQCNNYNEEDVQNQLNDFINDPGDQSELLLDIKREYEADTSSQIGESFSPPYLDLKPR